jgi:3-oxoacyl-[acyl-carrier-protein] synthase II
MKFVDEPIVITGTGCVTPLGTNTEQTYTACINNQSGIDIVRNVPYVDNEYAGQVPENWNSETVFPKKKHRLYDRFMLLMFDAVDQALSQSDPMSWYEHERVGIAIGSGVGGLQTYQNAIASVFADNKKVSPFVLPALLINLAGGHVSQHWNIKGPQQTASSACATSAQSIVNAVRMIQLNEADCVVAGGSEAAVTKIGLLAFGAMRALSTSYKNEPKRASRPWDKDRDGFILSEGAGAMVIERESTAKKRGAFILAYVAGIGQSSDAYHFTAPCSSGDGAQRAMKMALNSADIEASEVGYINAHATSTLLGDDVELLAIENVFDNPIISSTKSHHGHLLGAAGVVESIITIESLNNGVAPGTLNLETPSQLSSKVQRPIESSYIETKYALSNSFAFGGINISLIYKRGDN